MTFLEIPISINLPCDLHDPCPHEGNRDALLVSFAEKTAF
jgi:hypothetical protein